MTKNLIFRNKTDKELVELLPAGGSSAESAFEEIVRRYQPELIRYSLRLGKSEMEKAEDITQETFLSAFQYFSKDDPVFELKHYLYVTTRTITLANSSQKGPNVKREETL